MKSRTRTISFAILLAASTACAGYIAPSGEISFYASAPPPTRREVVIASPGPDHVWVSGHWIRQGNEYAWVPGSWVTVQTGHRSWVPGQWRHERRGWFWVEGHWR